VFEKHTRNSWAVDCGTHFPNRDVSNSVNVFNVNRAYKTADIQIKPTAEIELGDRGSSARWIVVLSERIDLEGCFLTLKSKTLFGVLPELIFGAIAETNRHDILTSLNAVIEAVSVKAPQSVIDACRNAASHVNLSAATVTCEPK